MTYEREPWEFAKGRYFGSNPTATERESGLLIEEREEQEKPLRRGSVGHRALTAWADGELRTAYDASEALTGDHHAMRREATRLVVRGFLAEEGTLPNRAPRGRKHVQAFRVTAAGRLELDRLQ